MPSRHAPLPRVYIHTLGCPKNEADSRTVMRSLVAAGVSMVADPEEATHILLNTCGFIRDAKEESIGAILDACAYYGGRRTVVMGCLVERYRRELEEGIPEVAGWLGLVGIDGLDGQSDLLRMLQPEAVPPSKRAGGTSLREASYAYVKISDGCDELCSFCAIPGIKGPYHSVSVAQILKDVRVCLDGGARELVLVGQDTAIWDSEGMGLIELIELMAAQERVRRIRAMYLQPEHVTDAFLRYMAQQPKLCRYLDVPFQHADPDVLKMMRRKGDGDAYLELLERARRLMPDVSVRSAFIVGFPGETDEQFDCLLTFVQRAGFDYAGGFIYSPEEGTEAAALRPRVSLPVARERLNRLNSLLAVKAETKHQRLVGTKVEVMIDSLDSDETGDGVAAVGRTAGQAPEVDGVTYIEGDLSERKRQGDVVTVTVGAALGYDLVGTCDAS